MSPLIGSEYDRDGNRHATTRVVGITSQNLRYVVGEPGALVSPAFAERFASGLKNCKVIHAGPGLHYLPEDHPEEIGAAVHNWLTELEDGGDSKP